MREDENVDRWLRDALADEPPQLSPDFDAAVERAVRPTRLSAPGRIIIAAYAVAAAVVTVWLTVGAGLAWMAGGWLAAALVAGAASAYARYLGGGHTRRSLAPVRINSR
jgi:hypothetical protein